MKAVSSLLLRWPGCSSVFAAVVLVIGLALPASAAADSFSFTTIDVPGASYTDVDGINATGQTVGYFVNSGGHGFLDMGGVLTPIDVPGASLTGAFGINASGQIVGEFFDNAGTHIHGFLAAPAGVPAPSTLLLLGTGLASGAAWARFRRRSGPDRDVARSLRGGFS